MANLNQQLLNAVYYNDLERLKKLIDENPEAKAYINDCQVFDDQPLPLYYITYCWSRTLSLNFIEEIMPFIKEMRKKVDAMLEYWTEQFGIAPFEIIDYQRYHQHFFCEAPGSTFEDISLDPAESFTTAGCRMEDLELYAAVCQFRFDETLKLLKEGADPNADLRSAKDIEEGRDDPYNCMNRIADECSYLCTCEVIPTLMKKQHIGKIEIGDLIGWAAHEDMLKLLEEY